MARFVDFTPKESVENVQQCSTTSCAEHIDEITKEVESKDKQQDTVNKEHQSSPVAIFLSVGCMVGH